MRNFGTFDRRWLRRRGRLRHFRRRRCEDHGADAARSRRAACPRRQDHGRRARLPGQGGTPRARRVAAKTQLRQADAAPRDAPRRGARSQEGGARVATRLSMAKEVLKAVKKQLGAEIKKTEEAQRAAKMATAKAEGSASCASASCAICSRVRAPRPLPPRKMRQRRWHAPLRRRRAPLPQRRPWQRRGRKQCAPHRRSPKRTQTSLRWRRESYSGSPSAIPRLHVRFVPDVVHVMSPPGAPGGCGEARGVPHLGPVFWG